MITVQNNDLGFSTGSVLMGKVTPFVNNKHYFSLVLFNMVGRMDRF